MPQNLHKNRCEIFPETIENNSDHPSCRCTISIQYLYNYFFNEKDIILVILDSDMFFIDYIDFNDYLKYDICFIPHSRSGTNNYIADYMWIGVIIFNNSKLNTYDKINFDCGRVNDVPVDAGGHSHFWLNKYKNNLSILYINVDYGPIFNENYITTYIDNYLYTYLKEVIEFQKVNTLNSEIMLNNKIFHIRATGSNWDYTNGSFINYIKRETNNDGKNINVFGEYNIDKISEFWKKYQHKICEIYERYVDYIILVK